MEIISEHRHNGQQWMSCALCRSLNQSKALLYRSMKHKVDWPEPTNVEALKPTEYTSVNEAFSNVIHHLNKISTECQKYLKSCPAKSLSKRDRQHLSRFHSSTRKSERSPAVCTEHVNIQIQPGSYAITAREQQSGQQQRHIVNVRHGQSIDLDLIP